MPVVAILCENIESPDEVVSATLTLYDDGAHGDGAAGDDVYGNTWTTPAGERVYQVDVRAADGLGQEAEYDNAVSFQARYVVTFTITCQSVTF